MLTAWTQTYGYDPWPGGCNTVSSAGVFAYTYDPTRQLQVMKELTLPSGASITNSYDSVARLATKATLENSANGSAQLLTVTPTIWAASGQKTKCSCKGELCGFTRTTGSGS